MALKGFDPEFTDLPDYIVRITARIWEGRGVGLIRRWYAPDCVVHTGMGPLAGAEAMVAGTFDTLNAFPDRRLLPEDVIWSGDDGTYLSSHRVLAPTRHDGPGAFGPPTGRELTFRAIADCTCTGNQIVEEWLVRDQAGIVRQIGLDPQAFAESLARADLGAGKAPWHLGPARALREAGQFRPPVHQSHPAARLVRDTMGAIWQGDLGVVRAAYHEACSVHAPGARTLHGHDRLERFLFGYLAAFPDARLVVEHSIGRDDPGLPARAATRWWLTGTHAGHGAFGPPTGAAVLVLGITHSVVVHGRIREEWVLVDEVGLRKQIAMQARSTGADTACRRA